ncbi:uncharacterized protein METZ01_LOCUS172311, partial [marine metagenome]
MMVTLVRGNIHDVHETLQYDADNPTGTSVFVEMDASKLWSGDEDRDGHRHRRPHDSRSDTS